MHIHLWTAGGCIHVSCILAARAGSAAPDLSNWSPFDMSGLEVLYPVRFFFEKEEV